MKTMLMKILEIGWLCVGILACGLACYKYFYEKQEDFATIFLFLVAALAIFMFFIKRASLRLAQRRKEKG